MRQHEGEEYLTSKEVKADPEFGWSTSTLYYLRDQGLLKPYSFTADRLTYWKKTELLAVKNRPPEVKKPGPKNNGGIAKPTAVAETGANAVTGLAPALPQS